MSNADLQTPKFIFHLVPSSEFYRQIKDGSYTPLRFDVDHFIHCTAGEELTMKVARDYFSGARDLLLLRILLSRVRAKVRFEAPAPIPGGGQAHLEGAPFFPHIYGALNLDAIDGIASFEVQEDSKFPQFS